MNFHIKSFFLTFIKKGSRIQDKFKIQKSKCKMTLQKLKLIDP